MLKYLRNRKTMGYLVGSFLLVLVIFAFIIFYVPDFMGSPGGGASLSDEIARVEDVPISAQEFYNRYRIQLQAYRSQLGDRFNPALIRQLGLQEMILNGMTQDVLVAIEAERRGLRVTDQEVGDAIVRHPSFQNDGRFIGQAAYLQILASSNPPLSPAQFEEQLRQELLRNKLQDLVTDGVILSSTEVEETYRHRNERANLEYILVSKTGFQDQTDVSDQDIESYYQKKKESFQLPTQRKLSYVTISPQAFSSAVSVADREIERYYRQNIDQYETPEQIRASHILFKTAEKDEAEVRNRAQEVLGRVKAGEDFAELARQYSEDTSAEQGGDLGLFGRGDMVPEFGRAAFDLEIGEVSELVRTTYGYHIIKVTDRQEPLTRPLDSVRQEIRNLLVQENSRDMMEEAIGSAADFIGNMQSLEALVQRYARLTLNETAFFGLQDPVPQLGGSAEARRLAFELEVGQVSPPLRIGDGYLFFQVAEEKPPRLPPLEEIKEQVRRAVFDEKAMNLARARAEEIASQLKEGRDASAAASSAGLEIESHESFVRGMVLPQAGSSATVTAAAFSAPLGTFSGPFRAANGYVLLRVIERTGFSPQQFATEKDRFSEQLLNEKRQQMWSAYLLELQKSYSIQRNWELLRQLTQ